MILFLLIAAFSLIAQLFLPWWSVAIVAFAVCFWRGKTGRGAFVAGFIGIALVWQVYALFIHVQNAGVMTGRMSQVLFKADMPIVLLELTVLLGGLAGGLAGLSGYLCRRAFLTRPV
ncbi:MAG: hypothetical protein H7Z72_11130 [Bacteroidetes bacterium]|nr:hypothetical protein [Fibrella sp.]